MKRLFPVPVHSPYGNYMIEIDGSVAQDVKLIESQKNVVSMPGPAKYRHLPTTPEDEDEIERSKKLLEILYPKPGMRPLTVGDLSVVTKEKKRLEDLLRRPTIQETGLDNLYQGPRPTAEFYPWISDKETESQKIDRLRVARYKQLAQKIWRKNNLSAVEAEIPEILETGRTLLKPKQFLRKTK